MRLDPGGIAKCGDDIPKSKKSAVDRDTLLDSVTLGGRTFQLAGSKSTQRRKYINGTYPLGASQVDEVKLGNDGDPITITTLSDRISWLMVGVVKAEGTWGPEIACLET